MTFTDSETEATCSLIVRSKGSADRISTGSETCSKSFCDDLHLVDSVGQPLDVQFALVIRSECLVVLIALADEFNRALHGPIRWDP